MQILEMERPRDYDEWKRYHNCSINYTGSAGTMEASGVKNIYNRSVDTKKLRYTTYLGDGDNLSFQEICESKPYPGCGIEKLECICHVQKS